MLPRTTPGRAEIEGALVGEGPVEVVERPDRAASRNYYERCCMKLHVVNGGSPVEVGDGGFVAWGQRLLSDKRERMFITGLGMERLVSALAAAP